MKIAELLEYKIRKGVNQAYTKDAIRQGDLYKDDLTFIKTLDPSIKVGYMKPNKEWLSIYLFADDICEGALEVEILGPHLEYFNDLKKQFGNRPFCKPHIALSPKLQGLGYAKMLYKIALDRGCIFVTEGHTRDAKRLWDSFTDYDTLYYVGSGVFTEDDEFARLRVLGKDLKD